MVIILGTEALDSCKPHENRRIQKAVNRCGGEEIKIFELPSHMQGPERISCIPEIFLGVFNSLIKFAVHRKITVFPTTCRLTENTHTHRYKV